MGSHYPLSESVIRETRHSLFAMADYQAHGADIGAVWRELAGPVYTAMAGIGTTGLWQPETMIEILGVAVIPDERLVRSAEQPHR